MIGKWGFSLLPFYLGIIPIFANNNYTLTSCFHLRIRQTLPHTQRPRGCQVIATKICGFFATKMA